PIIVSLEEFSHGLVPGRSRHRGIVDLECAESRAALDFPLRFRLHHRAFDRVGVELFELAAGLPGAQNLPGLPDAVDRVIRPGLRDEAAERLEHPDGAPAQVENARLDRQIAVEISGPGNAAAAEVAPQWLGELRGILAVGQGRARVVSRKNREEHREVGHGPRQRPRDGERGIEHVGRARGNPPMDVRNPSTLLNAAGLRSDPAWSLPSATGSMRNASAAAAPPLLPPEVLDCSYALSVVPNTGL